MGKGSSGSSTQTDIPTELKPLFTQTGQRTQEIQDQAPVSDFLDPSPAEVAPLSGLQQTALDQIGGISDRPLSEGLALQNIQDLPGLAGRTPSAERLKSIAGREITGDRLRSSPLTAAAQEFFTSEIQPGIENQATLAGLGRSTAVTNATAKARANVLLPVFQEVARAEEARIGRELGAEQTGLGLEERGIERGAGAVASGIPRLTEIGGLETGRKLSEIEAGLRGGDVERAVEQEGLNAEQIDFLRRQGIAEQALFGPLGQLPSTFGQTTSTSGGGGLFK